jgi:hypothetical protein
MKAALNGIVAVAAVVISALFRVGVAVTSTPPIPVGRSRADHRRLRQNLGFLPPTLGGTR